MVAGLPGVVAGRWSDRHQRSHGHDVARLKRGRVRNYGNTTHSCHSHASDLAFSSAVCAPSTAPTRTRTPHSRRCDLCARHAAAPPPAPRPALGHKRLPLWLQTQYRLHPRQPVISSPKVRRRAASTVRPRLPHLTRPHPIELHSLRRRQEMLVTHPTRRQPPLPQVDAPALAGVHPPRIPPMRLPNRPPQPILRRRDDDHNSGHTTFPGTPYLAATRALRPRPLPSQSAPRQPLQLSHEPSIPGGATSALAPPQRLRLRLGQALWRRPPRWVMRC